MFGVGKIKKMEMTTFIQQGCNNLTNSDSKELDNVTKDLYFK